MTRPVTVELDDETVTSLDRLAEHTSRSRGDLVAEAVQDYLQLRDWQMEKIAAGIAAADRGEFASDDELARIIGKYSTPA